MQAKLSRWYALAISVILPLMHGVVDSNDGARFYYVDHVAGNLI